MLDIVVPVVALIKPFPKSLFNCVAVRQGIEDKQHTVGTTETGLRSIYQDACSGRGIFNDHLLLIKCSGRFESGEGLTRQQAGKQNEIYDY